MSDEVKLLEDKVVEFFVDGVKILGLPKSVGEIYGLLYLSQEPMALGDIVERLGISKGSVSQGLKMLRSLGAVSDAEPQGRRAYYVANVELKMLVGGFIRSEVRPHLVSAKDKLRDLDDLGDSFYKERISRLKSWRKKSSLLMPLIQKFLGG